MILNQCPNLPEPPNSYLRNGSNNWTCLEKAVMIAGKRYEVGRGTILELNQSETAQTQAELTYVQSIYDYLKNKADLDYTLGRENYLK